MEKFFKILDDLQRDRGVEIQTSNHNAVKEYQRQALEQYRQLPVPGNRSKSWQKLPVQDIKSVQFTLAQKPEVIRLPEKDNLEKVYGDHTTAGSIRISEKTCQYWLNAALQERGVILCDLDAAIEKHTDLVQSVMGAKLDAGMEKMASLTAGMSRHGFFLYVPRRVCIEKPIEVHIYLEENNSFLPMLGMVFLEAQASASLISRLDSNLTDSSMAIFSINLEIKIGESASLQFIEIQKLGKSIWNFANENIILDDQAVLERFLLDSGGKITKRYFSVGLNREGSQASITGVYTSKEDQLFIYDTHQNHQASNTKSDLLFRGVLNQMAYSLWKGNVYVAEGTHGADGYQVNNNLMLAESAQAESIPGLEINSDDVRCSHAVTIGNIDPEQVFYLQSRGIDTEAAEKLIVGGFLQTASMRIKDHSLSEIVQAELV